MKRDKGKKKNTNTTGADTELAKRHKENPSMDTSKAY